MDGWIRSAHTCTRLRGTEPDWREMPGLVCERTPLLKGHGQITSLYGYTRSCGAHHTAGRSGTQIPDMRINSLYMGFTGGK